MCKSEDMNNTSDQNPEESRFPELQQLQQDVQRRLRDNQRFLENFLDVDFDDSDFDSEE